MRRGRALLAAAALLATLAAAPARGEPWAGTDAADLRPRVLAVDENRVLVLTPAALYHPPSPSVTGGLAR